MDDPNEDLSCFNGTYTTPAGSIVEIDGEFGGRIRVTFDWVEESACCDCAPVLEGDPERLLWQCKTCDGGWAALSKVTPNVRANRPVEAGGRNGSELSE